MQGAIVLALCAGGLLLIVSALRQSLREPGRPGLPWFMGAFAISLGGIFFEGGMVPPGRIGQALLLGTCIIGTIGALLSRNAASDRGRVPASAVLPAAIASVMFAVDALRNPASDEADLLARALAVALWLLIAVLVGAARLALESFGAVYQVAYGVVLVMLPLSQDTWHSCSQLKCGPLGALLAGPFESENYLGRLSAVAILLAFGVGKSRWGKFNVSWVGGLCLIATGSRTAALALGAGLIAWLLVRRIARSATGAVPPWLVPAVGAGLLATLAAGLWLVYHANPYDFSRRGALWARAADALGDDWWTGLGLVRWVQLQEAGALPGHYPHSQYLLMIFGGGLAALVLYEALLLSALRRSRHVAADFAFSAGFLTFLAVGGMTEIVWNPVALDGHTLMMIPVIAIICRSALQPPAPPSALDQPTTRRVFIP